MVPMKMYNMHSIDIEMNKILGNLYVNFISYLISVNKALKSYENKATPKNYGKPANFTPT